MGSEKGLSRDGRGPLRREAFSAAIGDDEEWYPGDEWLEWVFSGGLNPDDMD